VIETDLNGQQERILVENSEMDIGSFDFNYETGVFYVVDDKNNKVLFDFFACS
jgi:hypothetical protein